MRNKNIILMLTLLGIIAIVFSATTISASNEKALVVTGELAAYETEEVNPSERADVASWFALWGYDTWSEYRPEKSNLLARISDPSTKYYFQYGHGAPNGITITLTGPDVGLYASDVEVCLIDRDPMTFTFLFGCDCMSDTGPGTISYAFRKGSSINTVVIGYKGLFGSGLSGLGFRSELFEQMDTGCTIKEAFDNALISLPDYVGVAVFRGDESLVLEYGDTLYPELSIENVWIEDCKIHYNLENKGSGSAGPSHTQLRLLGVVVDTVPEAGLSAGQLQEGIFSPTWQGEWMALEVDCNNEVNEIYEGNNYQQIFWMCGDVNNDGYVRTSDGRAIFRYLTYGDPIDNMWAADVTGDGKITTADGRRIFRHITYGDPLNCRCG